MKNLDKDILKTIRGYYLLSIRGMALSADGSAEYWQNKSEAIDVLDKVFTLFGHAAAETLRKDGIREWNKICAGA